MIKEAITSYLKDNNSDYAIVMNGEWGCGKTYFIYSIIQELEKQELGKQESNSDIEIVYVSLFGTSSIEDFYKRIYWALHKFRDDILNKSLAGKIFSVMNFHLDLGILKFGIQDGSPEIGINAPGINASSNLNINNKDAEALEKIVCGEKRRLYIFDDIERISFGNVNVKEIFGAITNLIDQDKAKVLLICNEEKLSKDSLETYFEYKEKFVRHTFKFDPNIEYKNGYDEIYDDFIKDHKELSCFKNNLTNIFNKCKYKNLRTLKFIISVLNKVYKSLDCILNATIKEKQDTMKLLINFIVIYIVEHKDGDFKKHSKELEDLEFNMSLRRTGNRQNDSPFFEYLESIYEEEINKYHYISSVAEYIKTGTLNPKIFKEEIDQLYNYYIINHQDALLLNSLYNYEQLEDLEFKQKVRKFTCAIQNGKYSLADIFVIFNLLLNLEERGINIDIDDNLFIEQCENRIGSSYFDDFYKQYPKREEKKQNDIRYNLLLDKCKRKSDDNKTSYEDNLYKQVFTYIENNNIEELERLIQFNSDILLKVNIKELFKSLNKAKNKTVYQTCTYILDYTNLNNFNVTVIDDLIDCMTQFIEDHKGSLKTIKMEKTLKYVQENRNSRRYQNSECCE